MIRLAWVQARSVMRSPLTWIGSWALVPILWTPAELRPDAAPVLVGAATFAGIFARGAVAAGATSSFWTPALPALPVTTRTRSLATLLAAYILLLPGFALAVAFLVARGEDLPGTIAAAALGLLGVTPFVASGATIRLNLPGVAQFGLTVAAAIGAEEAGIFRTFAGALPWALVGVALLVAAAPYVAVAPVFGPMSGEVGPRFADPASPGRAYLRVQLMQPWIALLLLPFSLKVGWDGRDPHDVPILAFGALLLGMLTAFFPIAPVATYPQAARVLLRLPIAPHTVVWQALGVGVLASALALLPPTVAFVYAIASGGAAEHGYDAGSQSVRYFGAALVGTLVATLGRVGIHLRRFVAPAVANFSIVAGLLLFFTTAWRLSVNPLRPPPGAPGYGELVAAALVATLVMLAWATKRMGPGYSRA